MGAAFGVHLKDGRRILLKAHKNCSSEFLEAVRRVQGHLFQKGFPCPRPLAGPAPFGPGQATVEEFVDVGEPTDAHEPAIRRKMAYALARSTNLRGRSGTWGALLGLDVAEGGAVASAAQCALRLRGHGRRSGVDR